MSKHCFPFKLFVVEFIRLFSICKLTKSFRCQVDSVVRKKNVPQFPTKIYCISEKEKTKKSVLISSSKLSIPFPVPLKGGKKVAVLKFSRHFHWTRENDGNPLFSYPTFFFSTLSEAHTNTSHQPPRCLQNAF